MTKKAAITMASLVATVMMANAATDTVPIGTTRSSSIPPEARKDMANNQIVEVTHITLTRGKWYVAGGSTVQLNAIPANNTFFLYAWSAFVKGDPNSLPLKADTGLWAAPYNTYWVPNDPKSHTVVIDVDQQNVYLVVRYYGQIAAQSAQVFGSMTAVKVAD